LDRRRKRLVRIVGRKGIPNSITSFFKHIAFRVTYEDLKESLKWLESIQVEPVPFGRRTSIEPFVRLNQGNASVYFYDPDGNSLELMCFVEVPNELKHITDKLLLEDWENIVNST
jgi:hypothetical protein